MTANKTVLYFDIDYSIWNRDSDSLSW